jgi:hypothetical protein
MPNQPREANAEARVFAKQFREMFLALVEEGFTEQQALVIIGQVVAAGIAGTMNQ